MSAPPATSADEQHGGLGEQRAAVVLVEPVLAGLAHQQPVVGQAGQQQPHPPEVEGGVRDRPT